MKGRLSLLVFVLCSLPVSNFAADAFDGMTLMVLSLPKSPSGSKVTQKRTRSSAQPMAERAETSRIGSGVSPPGADRAERRRNLPARIETIRHFEERGYAALVYR